MPEFRPDECEWFDACRFDATGMAAHPDKGVIPVCAQHVDLFHIPLICKIESEN